MTIETKFDINDKVRITEIEKTFGRVVSIWITSTGIQYEVKYYIEGKVQKEYFFEDELEKT